MKWRNQLIGIQILIKVNRNASPEKYIILNKEKTEEMKTKIVLIFF